MLSIFPLAGAGCGENLATSQEKLRAADSPLVRAAAAERLGELGGDEAIRALTLNGLRDTAPMVRAASARALTGMDHPQVIDLLGEALMDPDADVRAASASALAANRREKARRYLELGYARSGSDGKAIIADALIAAGASPKSVVEEMAERHLARAMAAVQNGTQAERIGAMSELGRAATPEAVAVLLERLGSRAIPVAAAAASGLGDAGARHAVPALIEALQEPHPSMRRAVLDSLGKLEDPAAASAIAALATGERLETSLAAVTALGRLERNEDVRDALCRVVGGATEPRIVGHATRLLLAEDSSECDLASRVAADLTPGGTRVRAALAMIAVSGSSLLDDEGRDKLRLLLSHEDLATRAGALLAAEAAGLTEAGEEVMAALTAEREADERARDRWVRGPLPSSFGWGDDGGARPPSREAQAVRQLERAGLTGTARQRNRFEELMERVADYRVGVEAHRRTAQGLDERDPEEARARHREALFAESSSARLTLLPVACRDETSLLAALARVAIPLAGEAATEEVASLLEHPEIEVRMAAVEGLTKLSSPETTAALEGAILEGQLPEVLAAASQALAGRNAGRDRVVGALRWAEPAAQRGMVEALSIFGDEAAVDALIGLLDGPVVLEAARALARIGGENAGRALMNHLETIDAPGTVELLDSPPQAASGAKLAGIARRSLHSDWPQIRAAGARYCRRAQITDPWLEALRVDFDAGVRSAAVGGGR